MIAVSAATEKFLTCKETQIEAYTVEGKIEIAVPTTIDIAACLKAGISTINVQILRQADQPTGSAKTISQINQKLKSGSTESFSIASAATVLASKNVDITALITNFINREKSFLTTSKEEIASLLPTKTKVIPSQIESVTLRGDSLKGTDKKFASQFQDPAYQRTGSLPLDTVAAITGRSFDSTRGVNVLPVGEPKTRIVLADPTQMAVRLRIGYSGSSKDLSGAKLRITVRSRDVESQVITLRLSVASLLEVSDLPTVPPSVTGNFNQLGRARITVTQRDPRADGFTVTARPIKDYGLPTSGFSTVVENASCPAGRTISLELSLAAPSIVRVHPTRGDLISSIFGSTVLGSVRRGRESFSCTTASALIAINTAEGISIEILTNEKQADAALLRRLDIRSGIQTVLTPAPVPISSATGLIDSEVEDLASVRYEVDLYRSNGDVIKRAAVSEPITRLEPRQIVAADIVTSVVTAGNQMVKISITPTIKKNDINFLIDYIKALGLEATFQSDLENLKKSLLDCVKFDVTRIDLQTGEVKYVGQTSSTLEDDIDDVKITSNFLYVFDAFVRSPSQLADVINDRANKPVGSNPKITRLGLHVTKAETEKGSNKTDLSVARRFFSRSNFETGTMPSQASSDGFQDGRTGDIFTSRVTVVPALPTVSSVQVQTVRSLPVIFWKASGDTQLIDRYVVTGTSSGSTWTVAPAGNIGAAASLQVTDTLPHTLPRYITYSVYPVYLDGRTGATVSAGPVLVERIREV